MNKSTIKDRVSLIDQQEEQKKILYLDKSLIQFGNIDESNSGGNDDKIGYKIVESDVICGICYIRFDELEFKKNQCFQCKGDVCSGCCTKKIQDNWICDICLMKNTLKDQTNRRQQVIFSISENINRTVEEKQRILAEFQRSERQYSQLKQNTEIGPALMDEKQLNHKREQWKLLSNKLKERQEALEQIIDEEFDQQQQLRKEQAAIEEKLRHQELIDKELKYQQSNLQDRKKLCKDLEEQANQALMKNSNGKQNSFKSNEEEQQQDIHKSQVIAEQTYSNDLVRNSLIGQQENIIEHQVGQQNIKESKQGGCCNTKEDCKIF